MAALTPKPIASVAITTAANTGRARRARTACLTTGSLLLRLARRRRRPRLPDLEPARRFDAEQVLHEVIPTAADEIRIVAEPVRPIRHDQELEVLVRRDERVDQF